MKQKSIWNAASEVVKYSAIRPDHPPAIVDNVLKFLQEKYKGPLSLAIDVGCGSGMSTTNLFGKFENILGVDLSPAMIDQARKDFATSQPKVTFEVSGAEKLPADNQSAQLILVGRAIHYFDQQTFFKEVDRILVKDGVVAYYSVHFPTVFIPGEEEKGREVNKIFWDYMDNRLGPHWPTNAFDGVKLGSRNRRDYYVEGIKAPFAEMNVDESVSYDRDITISELARELDTYGGAVRHRELVGDKAADEMLKEFIARSMQALQTEDTNFPIKTKNSFYIVMRRKDGQ